MAGVKRKRTVRGVTLNDVVVEQFKAVGARLLPPEENLSRLLDRAMVEFIERHGGPSGEPPSGGTKGKGRKK